MAKDDSKTTIDEYYSRKFMKNISERITKQNIKYLSENLEWFNSLSDDKKRELYNEFFDAFQDIIKYIKIKKITPSKTVKFKLVKGYKPINESSEEK